MTLKLLCLLMAAIGSISTATAQIGLRSGRGKGGRQSKATNVSSSAN